MQDLIFRLRKDWCRTPGQFALGLAGLLFGSLQCVGQSSSLSPQILNSQQQIKWTAGPATASLGEVADLEIPKGFRFSDAASARVLLQRMRNPVSAGLVGILTPDSGAWWVVLEFSETGYVQPSVLTHIDAPAILKGLQAKVEEQNPLRIKQGLSPINSVSWETAPQYKASDNSLVCGMRIGAASEMMVNQTIRLFVRKGVLVATSVQKVKDAAESVPLKDILSHITVKTGQHYEDFQQDDKVAGISMYEMLTGDNKYIAPTAKGWLAFFSDRKKILWMDYTKAGWTAICLGVGVFVLVLFLVIQEIRNLNPKQSFRDAAARNGAEIKPKKARQAVNGVDAQGRRRAFDYQKFYSDMMMQVSTRSYTGLVPKQNEEAIEEVAEAGSSLPAAAAAVADAQKGAASELIARQKDFIEEQRRLMQQQTKLIEERSKLIEEKNQLLAKQSEMMENHLL